MSDSESEQKGGKRHFQYIDPEGSPSGRYSGIKPKQAANKVYSALWRERKTKGKATTGKIKFAIRECTRGSKRKIYYYTGIRQKLDEPTEVQIQSGGGGVPKTVQYNYSNKVMKDKEATEKANAAAEKNAKDKKKSKKVAKAAPKAKSAAKSKSAKGGKKAPVKAAPKKQSKAPQKAKSDGKKKTKK